MLTSSASDFNKNYQRHLQHLRMKGLQHKTIGAYSRAIRRIGAYFDHEMTDLSEEQLLDYFSDLLETHSWSSVKLDLHGLKFFYAHVLHKPWVNVGLIKPPKTQRLPDIVTVSEARKIFLATNRLSYKVFYFVLYSLGLRLGEGLRLQVGDIDATRLRVHVRDSKGNKDRFVPLPENTLHLLRRFWSVHRHPILLFPNRHGGLKSAHLASSPLDRGGAEFVARYQDSILPSQLKALLTIQDCRSSLSPVMLAQCNNCEKQRFVPHSCGHRNCPHCQSHESQQWLERQLKKELPADYFLITFTLPSVFRPLAWQHQRLLYTMMIACAWETVKIFAQNDKALQGSTGAISVLHTHSRRLDYHPHVHLVMPAGAINQEKRLWRTKESSGKKHYLFNHKALAKVFRAKMLDAIGKADLQISGAYPRSWIVNCKFAGNGQKALIYLGRYLYKGVLQEKDIVSCEDGRVSFRYQDSKSKKMRIRTLSGVAFLRLILQHVLPRGFRRTRNFGFLHPNSKSVIALIQSLCKINVNRALSWLRERPKFTCGACGGLMKIIKTMIRPGFELLATPEKHRQMGSTPVM